MTAPHFLMLPLKGENRLPMLLAGVTFTDGVAAAAPDHRAA